MLLSTDPYGAARYREHTRHFGSEGRRRKGEYMKTTAKFLTGLLAACAFLALSGCKSDFTVAASYNEIYSPQTPKEGRLSLQVSSCNDKGADFLGSSSYDAKLKVGFVMPSARYLGCTTEGQTSVATFAIPIQVGGVVMRDCKEDQVCLGSSQNNQNANFFVGKAILQKIKDLGDDASSRVQELRLVLDLKNDTGSDLEMYIPSALLKVGENTFEVLHAKPIMYPKDGRSEFHLPDVATLGLLWRGVVTAVTFPQRKYTE